VGLIHSVVKELNINFSNWLRKVSGEWRILHNGGINDPYNYCIFRIGKSRRWGGHVCWMRK
jgi:hypothetical protein